MEHLQNILDGMAGIFGATERRPYVRPEVPKDGFIEDARNLSGDWRAVAGDMTKAVKYTSDKYKALGR